LTRAIALVDLDDTLFQTLRKCPKDIPAAQLTPIGFGKDGSAVSFATPKQMAFIRFISETTYFVPVTARSHDALRRVRLDFGEAICAHGGMILDTYGEVDAGWDAAVRKQAAKHTADIKLLADALDEAAKEGNLAIHSQIQMEGDIALYPLARHRDADEDELHQVANVAVSRLPAGWTDHRNSNTVAFLPPYLGKQYAVAHILIGLRARFPNATVIGIGDSITDAPFMQLCDFAMTPSASQLARAASAGLIGT
jgi:hydroxymethylpyrimidine pyrophosphatase-like HAD family hydrolase